MFQKVASICEAGAHCIWLSVCSRYIPLAFAGLVFRLNSVDGPLAPAITIQIARPSGALNW